ncbi:hypothetical protein SAMN05443572_101218 [Myxococcus fulvus]|nr:hypothetical protein SAMN05443572_101218 [Myxococcus fulvus]
MRRGVPGTSVSMRSSWRRIPCDKEKGCAHAVLATHRDLRSSSVLLRTRLHDASSRRSSRDMDRERFVMPCEVRVTRFDVPVHPCEERNASGRLLLCGPLMHRDAPSGLGPGDSR